jgi:hypothetical protein
MRGLVTCIANLALGLVEHLILAALQALPALRAYSLTGLLLLDIRQSLITPLDNGFHTTSADKEHLRAVSRGNQGVHAQVHSNSRQLWVGSIRHFADEAHDTKRQSHFHQTAWQRDRLWQGNPQRATRAVRQD